ncbi:MAG TPA: UDP-N-acetylglucosamine 2-epimerase (non-hydrolyzing), partial [Bacteroidetes bacterium]|nr:UDP-N-acetylglucosamine 2-epimerase (non-hydrolyzing) [Bacteroidota bacterium]
MRKVLSVVGARPQFIKAAPVSRALRRKFHEVLVHTGQHYNADMSDVFFRDLDLPEPDVHLGVGSGTHAWQTGEMMVRLEKVLLEERPDVVLVYGDTNSTLAGALVASKLTVPLAHVEAGLRSYNRSMPEEINRVLTDRVSQFLFCPTQRAVENLRREGIEEGVYRVGDVMLDAARQFSQLADERVDILERLGLREKEYVLVTVHRAANTDDPGRLRAIVEALLRIQTLVVFPIHPRTEKALTQFGLREELREAPHVFDLSPVSYLENLQLERAAAKILTDSGGIQKEAYFFGIPCITLREETEWVETVEDGWNVLVGADTNRILDA